MQGKKKRKRQLILGLELLCVCCIGAFWFGSLAGKYFTPNISSQPPAKESREKAESPSEGTETDDESVQTDAAAQADGFALTDRNREISNSLLLVNRSYKLPEDYAPVLLLLPDGIHEAEKEAYDPLCSMLEDGKEEGLDFVVCSAYRNQKRQQELFMEDLEALRKDGYSYKEAYNEVAKYTMPPGCSEHSTGLAFDIVALDYQMLDEGQERTEENKWLREHCAEYGFILRYPKDKEDITQVCYESWHFRYVGKEAAQYIMEQGITLEEYLDFSLNK